MTSKSYDIITVGGGLGGCAVAGAMARKGARVLVLEAETAFRDRVRGEALMPWGVAEARRLGIYEALAESAGHRLPWWDNYHGQRRTSHVDLPRVTPQRAPVITFYHPRMQETMVAWAALAGARVSRGARAVEVKPGASPSVMVDVNGRRTEVRARLVIGADGRSSRVRTWAGFRARRDPDHNLIAGVLYDDMPVDDGAAHFFLNSSIGRSVLLFPQGCGRVRAYVCYPSALAYRLSGDGDLERFVKDSAGTGAPAEQYAQARVSGPLATFDGAPAWVEHPFHDGVALIGDAAAASDPTWGQGLSMALRDARLLRDRLLAEEDWDAAGHAYASDHDGYFSVLHKMEEWNSRMLLGTGPEADALRARALPLWREDRTRRPETFINGPDHPADETVRRRFFGEE
ncbi:MAG: FAD-dependent monooxygenase [Dehalococcoidia bacterium]|nr:FAD-dependent monooxygenase [Dehalococcoidia bacterium]